MYPAAQMLVLCLFGFCKKYACTSDCHGAAIYSYTLESLFTKADIELPDDFDEEQRQVLITGLQNNYAKVMQLSTSTATHGS